MVVINKVERTGTHHVVFVPVRIGIENLLFIYEPIRIGERRQEHAGGEFQSEHDGGGIRSLHRVDHRVPVLPRAQHAWTRKDDLMPARRDIGGGQQCAILKFDALTDLERIGLAVVGRRRDLGAQIAGKARGVRRVRPDRRASARCKMARSRAPTRTSPPDARPNWAAHPPGSYRSASRRVSAFPSAEPSQAAAPDDAVAQNAAAGSCQKAPFSCRHLLVSLSFFAFRVRRIRFRIWHAGYLSSQTVPRS